MLSTKKMKCKNGQINRPNLNWSSSFSSWLPAFFAIAQAFSILFGKIRRGSIWPISFHLFALLLFPWQGFTTMLLTFNPLSTKFDKDETVRLIFDLVKYRTPHRKQITWPNYWEKVLSKKSRPILGATRSHRLEKQFIFLNLDLGVQGKYSNFLL